MQPPLQTAYDKDGIRITFFDHGDESLWFASLHGQCLARVSSWGPGIAGPIRTHPRLDCPDTVMAILLERLAAHQPQVAA